MENFYEFAAEHPILTFFLVLVVCSAIVRLFRGYPPGE